MRDKDDIVAQFFTMLPEEDVPLDSTQSRLYHIDCETCCESREKEQQRQNGEDNSLVCVCCRRSAALRFASSQIFFRDSILHVNCSLKGNRIL